MFESFHKVAAHYTLRACGLGRGRRATEGAYQGWSYEDGPRRRTAQRPAPRRSQCAEATLGAVAVSPHGNRLMGPFSPCARLQSAHLTMCPQHMEGEGLLSSCPCLNHKNRINLSGKILIGVIRSFFTIIIWFLATSTWCVLMSECVVRLCHSPITLFVFTMH